MRVCLCHHEQEEVRGQARVLVLAFYLAFSIDVTVSQILDGSIGKRWGGRWGKQPEVILFSQAVK